MTLSSVAEHPNFASLSSERRPQRRPGPANPKYGVLPELWPDVRRRAEQGEPLRQIAKDYNVSYQTIWRILHHPHKQGG